MCCIILQFFDWMLNKFIKDENVEEWMELQPDTYDNHNLDQFIV